MPLQKTRYGEVLVRIQLDADRRAVTQLELVTDDQAGGGVELRAADFAQIQRLLEQHNGAVPSETMAIVRELMALRHAGIRISAEETQAGITSAMRDLAPESGERALLRCLSESRIAGAVRPGRVPAANDEECETDGAATRRLPRDEMDEVVIVEESARDETARLQPGAPVGEGERAARALRNSGTVDGDDNGTGRAKGTDEPGRQEDGGEFRPVIEVWPGQGSRAIMTSGTAAPGLEEGRAEGPSGDDNRGGGDKAGNSNGETKKIGRDQANSRNRSPTLRVEDQRYQRRGQKKRGPKTFDDLCERVGHAIRDVHDPSKLRKSSLVKRQRVEQLRRRRYEGQPLGGALALRDLISEAVEMAAPLLPPKQWKFLELYAGGTSIAQIAREMKMDRPYLSSTYRKKVAVAVTQAFTETLSAN